MIRQSQALTILLTRPVDQSRRFADELTATTDGIEILISPLMAPEFLAPPLPDRRFSAVIFTSETGVAAASQLPDAASLPRRAFCVGRRTGEAARACGFETLIACGDSHSLIALIRDQQAKPPLLFMRGTETTGDVEDRLNSAELETVSSIVYQQRPMPLSSKAAQCLLQTNPVVVPLFSPRSARLFMDQFRQVKARAPLYVAALSPAVAAEAAELKAKALEISAQPQSKAMVAAVAALIRAVRGS